MNLQIAYELDLARQQLGDAIANVPQRGDPDGEIAAVP